MTPHWSGDATVTDTIDGAGARRVEETGGGPRSGALTQDVTFRTQTTNTAGAVASTLKAGKGVQVKDVSRSRANHLTVNQTVAFRVRSGHTYEVAKYVGVDTSLTSGRPAKSAVDASQAAARLGWSRLFAEQSDAWSKLWRSDCGRAEPAGPAGVAARQPLRDAVQHPGRLGQQHQSGGSDQ